MQTSASSRALSLAFDITLQPQGDLQTRQSATRVFRELVQPLVKQQWPHNAVLLHLIEEPQNAMTDHFLGRRQIPEQAVAC